MLNPGGEIAVFMAKTMPRFEDVEIDRTHFDLAQRVPKLLKRPDFQAGWHLENERFIEIERLAKDDPGDDGRFRQMVVDHRNQLPTQCVELCEIEWIDDRQPLPQYMVADFHRHPLCEIIRVHPLHVTMSQKVAVGMEVDRIQRYGFEQFDQPFLVVCLFP